MDLNHLYHRHGVALLLAANARSGASRAEQRGLAAGYAGKIGAILRANAAAAP